jgi:hypothetical protein
VPGLIALVARPYSRQEPSSAGIEYDLEIWRQRLKKSPKTVWQRPQRAAVA